MRIGIDFDNTIASYEKVVAEIAYDQGLISTDWRGNRREIRDDLRRLPDGEKFWMAMQGQIYGKYMHRAQLVSGVANFLLRCLDREIPVFVVSHKTEYGHYDSEKIPLRIEAVKWMDRLGFLDPHRFGILRENIYFESTRKDKVERIALLKCTHFIDDLKDVFLEPAFPQDTKPILLGHSSGTSDSQRFSVFNTWTDITHFILGEENLRDVRTCLRLMIGNEGNSAQKISGRGNSRVYKVVSSDAKIYVLKCYPDQSIDLRPRLKTEFEAFQLLHQHNITNVPKAFHKDAHMNLALYEWIEGELVTEPTMEDLGQAINFVKALMLLSREIGEDVTKIAAGACLCAADLHDQIEERFKRLSVVEVDFPELSNFLRQAFNPLWEEMKEKSYCLWPVESRDHVLPRARQTLSPSDFGFHNALKGADGKLTFIDFDYFGWDDPGKLTADFIWHPAMELDPELYSEWKRAMTHLFSDDPEFWIRLKAAMPLYGIRWALILLNEFLPGFPRRRQDASQTKSYDLENARSTQLDKARFYLERVKRLNAETTYA